MSKAPKYGYFNPYIFGADFETDSINGRQVVVQWAISKGDGNLDKIKTGEQAPFAWVGRTVEQFMDKVKDLMIKCNHIIIYFHNFGGFDCSYLLEEIQKAQDAGADVDYIVNDGRPMMVKIQYDENLSVNFRDSVLKLNNTLRQIGEMIGVDKLMAPDGTEFEPGWSEHIDYSNPRYDAPDWKYVSMDAWICAKSMWMLAEMKTPQGFADGFTALTYSSDAFKMAKKFVDRNTPFLDFEDIYPALPIVPQG